VDNCVVELCSIVRVKNLTSARMNAAVAGRASVIFWSMELELQ
jgi:hypothetical protein